MKISSRESWMLAIAAPVLVLVISELAALRPLRQRVSESRREMDAKGEHPTWEAQLQKAQTEVGRMQSELDSLNQSISKTSVPLNHADALKQVSRLCSEGGLSLISSAQDAGALLTPQLQKAAPLLAAQNGGVTPEAWRIDVQGSYAQMRSLLQAFTSSPSLIVPLSLSMKVDEEGLNPTTWTLTLWL